MRRAAAIVWLLVAGSPAAVADEFAAARERMVKVQIEDRGITNAVALAAMRKVPRHEFVPAGARGDAYADRPLPIGHGQTISQPYIVAHMTELAGLKPGDKALEIGTGSGYQAAVLAAITTNVFSIEIIEPLAASARDRLKRLGYRVEVKCADGYFGWPEHAPFDAIVVTAAADHVPPPLVEQLKPGGRIVIPLGSAFFSQMLVVVEKDAAGKLTTRQIEPVVFVPLTRQLRP
jgi:protein-L-isoaspartate(D-aspartate) O-methyltransferase